jgi:hypothetical protein
MLKAREERGASREVRKQNIVSLSPMIAHRWGEAAGFTNEL